MCETETNAVGTSRPVRLLDHDETPEAAKLHVRELGGEFLSRFGEGFMERYYGAFLDSPYAVALCVADESGAGLTGVFIGAFDARAHYSYLVRKHGFGLATSAALAIFRSPRLALDVLRTRVSRYLRGIFRSLGTNRDSTGAPGDERPVGFAVYVAVEPGSRGRGVGRMLFLEFEGRCRSVGVGRIEAATRHGGLGEGFFERVGWKRIGEKGSGNERFIIFSRDLVEGDV